MFENNRVADAASGAAMKVLVLPFVVIFYFLFYEVLLSYKLNHLICLFCDFLSLHD